MEGPGLVHQRLEIGDVHCLRSYDARLPIGGQGCRRSFERLTDLEQLEDLIAVCAQPVTEQAPARLDVARYDEGASTLLHLDRLEELEYPEAFTYRDARHAELFGELSLGGKLLALADAPGSYRVNQLRYDAVRESLRLQGPEH